MRVSLIGLGAIGASYGSKLAANPDIELRVIADGERAERLRRDGVVVNGAPWMPTVVTPSEAVPQADLLMIVVKYGQFHEAIEQAARHIGPGTIVLSLLNGITSEDELRSAFPQAEVLYCIVLGIDAVRVGNRVEYILPGKLMFGQSRNEPPYSPSVRRVAQVLASSGIDYEIPADMMHELWWKFMINVGINQVSAELEVPYIVMQTDGPARDLMVAAQREVMTVARAEGVVLDESDLARWLDLLAGLGPGQYTSMAQDALAHRPTETGIFSGALCELAARHGIAVPVNEVLYKLMRARESQW